MLRELTMAEMEYVAGGETGIFADPRSMRRYMQNIDSRIDRTGRIFASGLNGAVTGAVGGAVVGAVYGPGIAAAAGIGALGGFVTGFVDGILNEFD